MRKSWMCLIEFFLSVSKILFGSVIIPKTYNTEYIKWIVSPFNSEWNWMWRWKFSLENKSHTPEYSHQPKIIWHSIVYVKLTYSIIMNSDSLFPFHLHFVILNPSLTTGAEWENKNQMSVNLMALSNLNRTQIWLQLIKCETCSHCYSFIWIGSDGVIIGTRPYLNRKLIKLNVDPQIKIILSIVDSSIDFAVFIWLEVRNEMFNFILNVNIGNFSL